MCGRYEGVDERVREALVDRELSIGDFVVMGGELPSLLMTEAIVRYVPGIVGDEQSVQFDSFQQSLLDFPHYTRPAEFRGLRVPEVLMSGNHEQIRIMAQENDVAPDPGEASGSSEAVGIDGRRSEIARSN